MPFSRKQAFTFYHSNVLFACVRLMTGPAPGSNRRLAPAGTLACSELGLFFDAVLCLTWGNDPGTRGTMPRARRVEYPGASYHVMDRGDRREDIATRLSRRPPRPGELVWTKIDIEASAGCG